MCPLTTHNFIAVMLLHCQVAFVDGNCICMRSKANSCYLSISADNNAVTGVASEIEESCKLMKMFLAELMTNNIILLAKFYVRTTNEGSVLLQSATNAGKYLSISDDVLNCKVSDYVKAVASVFTRASFNWLISLCHDILIHRVMEDAVVIFMLLIIMKILSHWSQ